MSTSIRARLWNFFESLTCTEQTDASPKAETPAWLRTPLLPHQRTSLAAALALETSKTHGIAAAPLPSDPAGGTFFASYGILADRVGSGKSLVALALVKAPPPPSEYTEFVSRNTYVLGDGRDTGMLRKRTQLETNHGHTLRPTTCSLLILPHALMEQWTTYIERDTTLRAKVVRRKAEALNPELFTDIDCYDLLLVSSTMWNTVKEFRPAEGTRPLLKSILWRRIFVDEADSIAFTNSMDELHGLFYWFITASYMNLVFSASATFNLQTSVPPLPSTPPALVERIRQSMSGPYFNIMGCRHRNIVSTMAGISSHANNGIIPSSASHVARLLVRNNEDYISSSFVPPTIQHTVVTCATPKTLHVLDTFISPEMMERLHAGDVAGAMECVGMTSQSEEELVGAVTASWTKELEQARLTHEYKKSIEYSSDAAKIRALEACEAKIASLSSRIQAVEDRVKQAKAQTCPICCCDIQHPALTPCCHQVFCFGCLCETFKRVAMCPLCRERIEDIKAVKIIGSGAPTNAVEPKDVDPPGKKKGKRETAIEILMSLPPSSRTLIFSSYDASFSGLSDALERSGIATQTVNGSQARVSKVLREFADGKHTVLFLNAGNMGAGLNIATATHVMLFHKMSKELETQIVGRAVRLGRAAPLQVIHLLHDNELRENVVTYH